MVSVLQWRIHWQLCIECIEGPKSVRYVPDRDVSDKILVGVIVKSVMCAQAAP